MYCLKCGAYISERDKECYMCGSSINAQREMLIKIKRQQNELQNLKRENIKKSAGQTEALKREAIRRETEQLADTRRVVMRLDEERREAERLEAERLEAERQEAARLEAERQEAARLEAQRQEAARLEAERLEAERLEAERLEAERLEAERREAAKQASIKRETMVLYTESVPEGVITPAEPVRKPAENTPPAEEKPAHPNYIPENYYPQKVENAAPDHTENDNSRAAYKDTMQKKSSYTPETPAAASQTASGGSRNNIIMQVFCFIAAGLFAWFAFSGLRGPFYNITYAVGSLFRNPLGYAVLLLSSLVGLICSVIALGMAGLFIVAALRWTREKAEAYFAVTAEATVVLIVAEVLSALLGMIAWLLIYSSLYYSFVSLIRYILFFAVVLAAYYGVNAVCGAILFKGMDGNRTKQVFMEAPAAAIDAVKNRAGGTQPSSDDFRQGAYDAEHRKAVENEQAKEKKNSYSADDKRVNRPYVSPAAANSEPLATNRGLLKYIVFGFLTCGIYQLYVIYKIAKDVNIACEGDGKSTAGLLKLFIFTFLTCGIYSWIWYYSLGNRLQENAPRYGMHFSENGTTILMWDLFGILLCGIGPFIAMNIIFKNTNAICAAYNEDKGF